MSIESILVMLIVVLTVLVVQFLVKPPIRKRYRSASWYGLCINVLTIIIFMAIGTIFILADLLLKLNLIDKGVDFLIQIFATIFLYEIANNIIKMVRVENGKKKIEENGEE